MRTIVRFMGLVFGSIAAWFLVLAILASTIGGMILAVLVMKDPVQGLLDSPAGNQLGGPVIIIIVMAGFFGGSIISWLAFVGVNEIFRCVFDRNLFADYDPVFWREYER